MYTIDPSDPGYRAAMDRNVAFAIDALTRQARQLDHLDPAVATHRLALDLAAGRCDRQQLAPLLAALAVRTVRADQQSRRRPQLSITSKIMVQDPVDAYGLFAAARAAVGLPVGDDWHRPAREHRLLRRRRAVPVGDDWYLCDFGDVHMLQTGQGVGPMVSVHFAPGGGLVPGDDEVDAPDGYALAGFITSGTDREAVRSDHERMVAALGEWLTEHRLRWSWQYENELWVAGDFLREG